MPDFDLISDLHLDMRPKAVQMLEDINPTSKLLVIAGDLCEARNLQQVWVNPLSDKYERILYVLGNHEYYGSSKHETYRTLLRSLPDSWELLDNEYAYTEGGCFAGTTLWFPDKPDNRLYEHHLNDFHQIEDFRSWVYEEHEAAKQFLRSACSASVWITHHLPLAKSIHSQYLDSPVNRFFLGDISDLLMAPDVYLPKIIVHGHTHEPCDYMAGYVRVVCNPLGYPQEGSDSILPVLVAF